jgi:hypothetical protein
MYRKYLIPSLYRRFFGIFNSRDALLSEETGSVRVGYYVTFYSDIINSFMSDINANKGKSLFNKQFKDTKALAKTYLSILSNNRIGGVSERNEKYSETELSNIRKALFEQLTLLLLASLLMLIDLDDDEDKSEVSNLRWYMMYLIKRLLKEQNALAFNPMIGNPLEDNWKVLSSPSAAQSFIERVFKVVSNALNHLSPYGDNLYYERDSGIAEEGDSKLKVSIEKLFGTLNVANMFSTTTPEEMYENLNRTF